MGIITDKIFHRYEHLAKKYANKIWNEENLGLEKEDIEQELKIRLFLAIKAYTRRWKEFKDTGKNKPVHIEFYLKTTMINKSRDFIKEINSAKFIRSSQVAYDRGNDCQSIEIKKSDILIGSDSILDIFSGEEKRIMKILIIREFDISKTKKYYKGSGDIDQTLEKLKEHLKNNQTIVNEYEVFATVE